ncbi:Homeodomain-like domain-containing protein [Sinosporangium album]|uniref:Homeodomain-like domain-containing protein n=2 Tax=Sinosporangium album TaxID=504805 RepID=A0A1G7W1J0_9ACTN|nr:Homeodomain-like domain-containing protein [Sinosporangium album]
MPSEAVRLYERLVREGLLPMDIRIVDTTKATAWRDALRAIHRNAYTGYGTATGSNAVPLAPPPVKAAKCGESDIPAAPTPTTSTPQRPDSESPVTPVTPVTLVTPVAPITRRRLDGTAADRPATPTAGLTTDTRRPPFPPTPGSPTEATLDRFWASLQHRGYMPKSTEAAVPCTAPSPRGNGPSPTSTFHDLGTFTDPASAVAELPDKGFASTGDTAPATLAAIPRGQIYQRILADQQALLDDIRTELTDRHHGLLDLYDTLGRLQALLATQAPDMPDDQEVARLIQGPITAPEAVLDLHANAVDEVRVLGTLATWDLLAVGGDPSALPPTSAGTVRVVVSADVLRDRPHATRLVGALGDHGAAVRVHNGLPGAGLSIVDDDVILPVPTPTCPAVLVVRHPLFTETARHLFESVWHHLPPADRRPPPTPVTQPVRQRILTLLAAGRSDREVAREVGVTERTIRRHVASLMEEWGAKTRMHLGALAVRHGWIT